MAGNCGMVSKCDTDICWLAWPIKILYQKIYSLKLFQLVKVDLIVKRQKNDHKVKKKLESSFGSFDLKLLDGTLE